MWIETNIFDEELNGYITVENPQTLIRLMDETNNNTVKIKYKNFLNENILSATMTKNDVLKWIQMGKEIDTNVADGNN